MIRSKYSRSAFMTGGLACLFVISQDAQYPSLFATKPLRLAFNCNVLFVNDAIVVYGKSKQRSQAGRMTLVLDLYSMIGKRSAKPASLVVWRAAKLSTIPQLSSSDV